jgi:hypothetical protein
METTIIIAIITAGVSLVSIIVSKYFERRIEVRRQLHEKKIKVYTDLLASFPPMMRALKNGEKPENISGLMERVLTWSSSDVLLKYFAFLGYANSDSPLKDRISKELIDVILAIRSDLGYRDPEMNDVIKKGMGTLFIFDSLEKNPQ